MRRARIGGEEDETAAGLIGPAMRAATGTATGVKDAAGGVNWTAATGVAVDSADSMWQQAAGVPTVVPAGAWGP